MTDEIKKPLSAIFLTGTRKTIIVEKSLKELIDILKNEDSILVITDIDGMHYAIPKEIIKMVQSEGGN